MAGEVTISEPVVRRWEANVGRSSISLPYLRCFFSHRKLDSPTVEFPKSFVQPFGFGVHSCGNSNLMTTKIERNDWVSREFEFSLTKGRFWSFGCLGFGCAGTQHSRRVWVEASGNGSHVYHRPGHYRPPSNFFVFTSLYFFSFFVVFSFRYCVLLGLPFARVRDSSSLQQR